MVNCGIGWWCAATPGRFSCVPGSSALPWLHRPQSGVGHPCTMPRQRTRDVLSFINDDIAWAIAVVQRITHAQGGLDLAGPRATRRWATPGQHQDRSRPSTAKDAQRRSAALNCTFVDSHCSQATRRPHSVCGSAHGRRSKYSLVGAPRCGGIRDVRNTPASRLRPVAVPTTVVIGKRTPASEYPR